MRQTFFVLLIVFYLSSTVEAAPTGDDFEYAILPASTDIIGEAGTYGGGEVDLQVVMNYTNPDAPGIEAWSFGIMLEQGETTMEILSAAASEEVMTVQDGAEPDYESFYFDEDNDTVLQGNVLDFEQEVKLYAAEATDFPLVDLRVSIEGHFVGAEPATGEPAEPPQCGRVVITDTVGYPGKPAVDDIITVEGMPYTPGSEPPAQICLVPKADAAVCFAIAIGDAEGETNEMVSSEIILDFSGNPDVPTEDPVQGWSYGVCVDDTSKAIVADAVSGTDTATVKDGGPPDYDRLNTWDKGLTHGVLIDFQSVASLHVDNPDFRSFTDVRATYEVLMTEEGDNTWVTPCSRTLGSPLVGNQMTIRGESKPECMDQRVRGAITYMPGPLLPWFLPGDANADGMVDLADGIFILKALFRSGAQFSCEAAADFTGDGTVDTKDALNLIYWRFQPELECADGCQGPALGTECGQYETPLTCEQDQC